MQNMRSVEVYPIRNSASQKIQVRLVAFWTEKQPQRWFLSHFETFSLEACSQTLLPSVWACFFFTAQICASPTQRKNLPTSMLITTYPSHIMLSEELQRSTKSCIWPIHACPDQKNWTTWKVVMSVTPSLIPRPHPRGEGLAPFLVCTLACN